MAKKPRGRPTRYTEAAAKEICTRLANGESLRSICSSPHLPSSGTVLMWVVDDRNGFAKRYERAREAQAHHHADAIGALASVAEDMARDEDAIPNAIKVAIDARKWCAERMSPSRYYVQRKEVTGANGGPVEVGSSVTVYVPSNGREAGGGESEGPGDS